jgi:hypothetical protein
MGDPVPLAAIHDASADGRSLVSAANFAAMRGLLELATYYAAIGHNHSGVYSPVGHTHTQSDVTGLVSDLAGKVDSSSLSESIDDRVAALLVAGTNITITYNDASNTLTIASTGGGGGIGGSTGATDNRLLRADGTGGATAQNSSVTVDDSGNISGIGTVGCGAITSTGVSQIAQIGIGTASPDYPLHVLKTTATVASGFHLASSYSGAGNTYVADFGEYGCIISHQREPQVGTFVGNAVSPNQKRAVGMQIGGSLNLTYWSVIHYPGGVATVLLSIDGNGKLKTRASTTAAATLNIPSGTAPTSPVDGDIWSDGSNLKVRLGGVTYTLDKT